MDGPIGARKAGKALRFAAFLRQQGEMRALALAAALMCWSGQAAAQTDPLHRAVDAYALYQADIGQLAALDLRQSGAVDRALELAARHDPERLARGWIAYGGLVAAQSPAFAQGVQSRVRAAGRAPVLRQLRRDLSYARQRPPGSAEAIQTILAAAANDNARLLAVGERVTRTARDMDGTTLGGDTAQREARNARLRVLWREPRSIAPELAAALHLGALAAQPHRNAEDLGGRLFWNTLFRADAPAPRSGPWREHAPATSDRMLTLGALLIVGATQTESARVEAALDDATLARCLSMEQLQLRQCVSASHYANEDAYCLARHGLEGPAACFGAIGG